MIQRVGPVGYEVRLPGWQHDTQVYHINLLKAWRAQKGMLIAPYLADPELGPDALNPPPPSTQQWSSGRSSMKNNDNNCND